MENQKKDNRSYWKGKKLSESHRRKLSESRIGNQWRNIPVVAYDDGFFYGRFDSIKELGDSIGSPSAAQKLANGWVPTMNSSWFGWSVKKEEE